MQIAGLREAGPWGAGRAGLTTAAPRPKSITQNDPSEEVFSSKCLRGAEHPPRASLHLSLEDSQVRLPVRGTPGAGHVCAPLWTQDPDPPTPTHPDPRQLGDGPQRGSPDPCRAPRAESLPGSGVCGGCLPPVPGQPALRTAARLWELRLCPARSPHQSPTQPRRLEEGHTA